LFQRRDTTGPKGRSRVTLLEVSGLTTELSQPNRTVRAVDDISFSLEPGETVGLVGESGSGKTMTGRSILRLLPTGGRVVSGQICFEGLDLVQCDDAQMRQVRGNEIGMVFQDPLSSLNPTMSIGDQVAEPLAVHRDISKAEARQRVIEMLGLLGLPQPAAHFNDYPHQFSGGMRQRVMIAMALICQPKLLIADEPTTALDVTIQAQLLALLGDLRRSTEMSILFITHDIGILAGIADRIMVMYAGRIVEEASTATLLRRPRHRYTQALLGSIPRMDSGDRRLRSIPGSPPDLSQPRTGCSFAPRCGYGQPQCTESSPVLVETSVSDRHACFYPVAPFEAAADAEALPGADALLPVELVLRVPSSTPAANVLSNDDPLLVMSHVVREFPVTSGLFQRRTGSVKALSDVSISIRRGETFALVGESGCGKTTLGRLAVGLDRPDSGTISFDGTDLASLSKTALRTRRRDLQLMFQDPYASLDPRMRIGQVLREPLAIQKLGTREQQEERIAELLREVGLPPHAAHLYPHEFSGGQRQRIGLARALAVRPKLIVADEPVSALDVSIRAQILNLMQDMHDQHNLSYLVISHDLTVVRCIADRVGVLYLGKLVELGDVREVFDQPAHPYTKALLDAVPDLDPDRRQRSAPLQGELPSALHPPSGCRFRTRCPRAEALCAEAEPPLREFTATGRVAACHFPLIDPMEGAVPVTISSGSAGHTDVATLPSP
jgi:peptide/nickel transport system ATP-binding protein